jgi:hypothetical protein
MESTSTTAAACRQTGSSVQPSPAQHVCQCSGCSAAVTLLTQAGAAVARWCQQLPGQQHERIKFGVLHRLTNTSTCIATSPHSLHKQQRSAALRLTGSLP